MRIEPAGQFAASGRAPGTRGYGESVEALVAEYAPLVRKIAWQVFSRVSRKSELDDLIQTGLIALIEASRHYEERGFALAAYATTRIRGAMIDQLRREADVGRSAMVAAKRIQAMRGALEQQLMRAPTTAEMAVAFEMSAEDYFALERNATHGRPTSLDELTDIGAFLATDEDAGAHERCEPEDLKGAPRQCVGRQSDRAQMATPRYFFEAPHPHQI